LRESHTTDANFATSYLHPASIAGSWLGHYVLTRVRVDIRNDGGNFPDEQSEQQTEHQTDEVIAGHFFSSLMNGRNSSIQCHAAASVLNGPQCIVAAFVSLFQFAT
jgi:hypothetical protein